MTTTNKNLFNYFNYHISILFNEISANETKEINTIYRNKYLIVTRNYKTFQSYSYYAWDQSNSLVLD